MQHIIVNTANRDGLHAPDWRQNPGGKYFSRHFGFGLFDAGLMVYNAKQWKNVPPAKVCNRKTTDGFTERLFHFHKFHNRFSCVKIIFIAIARVANRIPVTIFLTFVVKIFTLNQLLLSLI